MTVPGCRVRGTVASCPVAPVSPAFLLVEAAVRPSVSVTATTPPTPAVYPAMTCPCSVMEKNEIDLCAPSLKSQLILC